VKCAYDTDGWEIIASINYQELDSLKKLLSQYKNMHLVISSVSDAFNTWFETLNWQNATFLTTADIPTQRLDYETPHTLGLDRWLSCAGAFALSQQTVAVCSAGSALTIDLMDQYGVFRGGVILPGLDVIEKAAHLSAPRLPMAYLLNPLPIPARSTDDCIDAGARWMVSSTLRQVLDSYESTYGLLRVWACGGRGKDLVELLRGEGLTTQMSARDVRLDDILVFRGLKHLFFTKMGY
jgi:type III pantothenate kinase